MIYMKVCQYKMQVYKIQRALSENYIIIFSYCKKIQEKYGIFFI